MHNPMVAAAHVEIEHGQVLDDIALHLVRSHAAPCAVVACACRVEGQWVVQQGAAGTLNGKEPAGVETLFDLASLTKPFTALTFARLAQSQLIEWSTPLGVLVREAQGQWAANVPLGLLAAHRAGLGGHRPLYEPLVQGRAVNRFEALQEAAGARRLECTTPAGPDGWPPLYSDLGYLLLGEALERAAALQLDRLIEREVCEPLGLQVRSARRLAAFDPSFALRTAPTEVVPWRGGEVRAQVHDENAWALGDLGCCGHAGLFGTAHDVARLGIAVLEALRANASPWLGASYVQRLVQPRPGGTLRAGFDGKSAVGSSTGELCGMRTFGHLGFTGTSMWMDPDSDVVVVVLSNRVHPSRNNERLKALRPTVHDALVRRALDMSAHVLP